MLEFNQPLNQQFASIPNFNGRYLQVLNGNKAVAFSSHKSDKDLMNAVASTKNNTGSYPVTIRMKFNHRRNSTFIQSKNQTQILTPITPIEVTNVRLFTNTYKDPTSIHNCSAWD